MKTAQWIIYGLGLMVATSVCVGCSASNEITDGDEPGTSISWLLGGLQEEGVFVRERGEAALYVAASSSIQLLLDSREVVDVYSFEYVDEAQANALTLANNNPEKDVYYLNRLVVVRHSERDTGLSQTLRKILGNAL